ncbi:glycosyltransferase family 2 protein [Leptolyngbya ohadii]|uniref:glycosyltransferase family 2 protein n=1 Tax=Leptolyngbya ohadii TaxID=1962290 RepID=UPI000B59F354|nr:glycosyltransferase family 2 protein [Leptolyngbya ohadii]
MVKISIITPSYNQGQFIADAIQSVNSQEYPDKEHIIVDAQSTDETLDVIKRYAHLSHLKWISEPDKGQSDAINKGFKMATGDIVAWLNADDYYLPETFSKVAQVFTEFPKTDVIYGDTLMVDQDKKSLKIKKDHRFDYGVLLYYGCYIQSTTTFFRKSIIDADHLIDISYKLCMDYEYFVRLSSLGYQFSYLPSTLAAFRWHKTNFSVLYPQRRREETIKIKHQYGYKVTNNLRLQTLLHDVTYFYFLAKRQALKQIRL